MSASTALTGVHSHGKAATKPASRWPTILMWTALLVLLIVAIWMRLIGLGLPFDRDGYDEGVYWQSLMAMRTGNSLYGQIFYSQPPFFLLSTYPIYILFGGSLWSARLGIALVSLVGLVGAFLLGKALQGRLGAVLATLLVVADPLYLSLSQKIEAEVSSTAFSLLAVGAAYMWWESSERTEDTGGLMMAILCGIALPLGIFCKLLSLTAVAPVGLLVLARLWQYWQKQPGVAIRSVRAILVAVGTCIVVTLLVVMPFLGSYTRLAQDVISFHTQARAALINNQVHNIQIFKSFLFGTWPLVVAAAFGLLASCIRRDWRVLPLLAWLLLTMYMLWLEVPLFYRHFVALLPALIGLAILGVGNLAALANITDKGSLKSFFVRLKVAEIVTALAVVLVLVTVGLDVPQYRPYYQAANRQGSDTNNKLQIRVAHDLDTVLTPQQLVLTDGQFVAALADRNTPPSMVDTSMVRIAGGYLTQQQLINAASQPDVRAVLFFTSRLNLPQVAGFYTWVKEHYHLKYRYGPGRELWVR